MGLGIYLTSARVELVIDLPTIMRAAPSIIATSGTNYYDAYHGGDDFFDGWAGVNTPQNNSFIIYASSGVGGTEGEAVLVSRSSASADVAASAEL